MARTICLSYSKQSKHWTRCVTPSSMRYYLYSRIATTTQFGRRVRWVLGLHWSLKIPPIRSSGHGTADGISLIRCPTDGTSSRTCIKGGGLKSPLHVSMCAILSNFFSKQNCRKENLQIQSCRMRTSRCSSFVVDIFYEGTSIIARWSRTSRCSRFKVAGFYGGTYPPGSSF